MKNAENYPATQAFQNAPKPTEMHVRIFRTGRVEGSNLVKLAEVAGRRFWFRKKNTPFPAWHRIEDPDETFALDASVEYDTFDLKNEMFGEDADVLRALYSDFVKHPDGHWKGRAEARCPRELARLVKGAMDFMGSLVDDTTLDGPDVILKSEGYWAHGF